MKKNKLLINASIYGLLSVTSRLTAVITAPITTKVFTVEEYGIMDVLTTVISMLALFIALNLNSGVFRLYYEKSENDRKKLLSSSLLFYLAISGAVTVAILLNTQFISTFLFKTNIYYSLLMFAFIRFPFVLAYQQFLSLLRILHNARSYAFFSVTMTITSLGLVVALYITNQLTLFNLILLQSIIQIILTIILFAFVRGHYLFKWDKRSFKEITNYSLPLFPSVIINFFILSSLPILITQFATQFDTGIYSLARKMAIIFGSLLTAFRMAVDPMLMQVISTRDKPTFINISREAFNFYHLFLFPFIIFIYLTPTIFDVFIDDKFAPAISIINILAITLYLAGLNNIMAIGIAYTKRTKYISYAQTYAFILFVILAYPLISNFGARGAVYIVLISVIVQNIFIYIYSNKLLKVGFDIYRVALTTLIMFGLSFVTNIYFQIIAVFLCGIYFLIHLRRNRFLRYINDSIP